MKRSTLLAANAAIAAALLAPAIDAQYKIPWSTVDSGGAAASAPTWSLRGSHGQPDAGDQSRGARPHDSHCYLPLLTARDPPEPRCVAS